MFSRKYTIADCSSTSIFVLLLLSAAAIASSQYQGYGYGMAHGQGGYGYGSEGQMMDAEVDERPRVQLGIRLKIPAIKFELPRVSLPKVTISAKIRQPDRPRTISLPEINLDTSSRVVPPGAMGPQRAELGRTHLRSYGGARGGAGYASSASNNLPSYGVSSGPEAERTQSFTFSTHEERTVSANSYPNHYPARGSDYTTNANLHPSHMVAAQQNKQQLSPQIVSQIADSDADFDRPANLQPGQQTIYANEPLSPFVHRTRSQHADEQVAGRQQFVSQRNRFRENASGRYRLYQ